MGRRAKSEEHRGTLVDQLDDLLEDNSLPEVVEGLVKICERYSAQLRVGKNPDSARWDAARDVLREALGKLPA
jgi:hypothetical protein